MPNDDLFTNDVMLFRLNESYWMRTIVLCSCIVFLYLNHRICLILFAVCAYWNDKVTSSSNPHVDIANPIKINK